MNLGSAARRVVAATLLACVTATTIAGCSDDASDGAERAVAEIADAIGESLPSAVTLAAYEDDAVNALFVREQRDDDPDVVDDATTDGVLDLDEFQKFPEVQDFANHHREAFLTPFMQAMSSSDDEPDGSDAYAYVAEHLESTLVEVLYDDPELRVIVAGHSDADPASVTRADFASAPAVHDFIAPILDAVDASIEPVLDEHGIDAP